VEVRQAVLRVGLKECAKLICAYGMRRLYDRHPPAVKARCEALLRHSLFVAHIAAGLNRAAKLGHGGSEFTAGLLHDIGRVIVGVRAPAAADHADPVDAPEDGDTLRRERDVLGIDHCAVGFQFATRAELPETIVRAVLNHHRPHEEHLRRELVALVAVADRLANYAQTARKLAGFDPDRCPAFEVLTAEWERGRRRAVRAALSAVVIGALRETRAILKAFG
jgi:putative nucleotidyltransferase with HDIG domain